MPPSNPDIPTKIQELQNTQSQVRFWRTLTIIAVILIVVTCVGMISTAVTQLTTRTPVQEKFVENLMVGVNQDVLPEVQRIVSNTAADVAPLIQIELNQLNMRAPEFAEALRQELYKLSINVSARGEKVLNKTVGGMIERRQDWIRSNFEGVTKDKAQTMAENLATVAHERVAHLTDTLFADQVVALNRITENLHAIQKAELENVRHEVPRWEMALLFFDVVRDELRGMESLNSDTSKLDEKDITDTTEEEGSEDK